MSIEQLMYRHERWMYRSGRPNALAVALNRFWAIVGTAGLRRHWLVTLEVPGRVTGRTLRSPLVVANHEGAEYLVSMLGERAQWVRNVRATGGRVALRRGRRERVRLVEVPVGERAPILRRYLDAAPAARSFVPIDRRAPLEEFAKIAANYPVFRIEAAPESVAEPGLPAASTSVVAPSPRRRRWRRWLAILGVVLAAIVVVSLVGIGAYLKSSAPPPLALPATVAAPTGPIDGTWTAGSGSVAGFRIQQTVLGMTGDVAGRTNSVSGTATVAGGQVTAASFDVDLATVTASGKRSPQFDQTLETAKYPHATFTLTAPVTATPAFESGAALEATATGRFTLHGVTRTVTSTFSVRRDGAAIDLAGSIPVTFADYDVSTPAGYGALGSLADHGTAEFLVILRRS